MQFRFIVGLAAVVSIGVVGCNRPAQETRDEAKDTAASVADATADAQRSGMPRCRA